MVLWWFLSPPDLPRAQGFQVHEVLEVVVVSKNNNFMLAVLQVVSPSLESFNNCQQLFVVGFIPSLYRNHLSREQGYRMPSARIIRGQLIENSTNSIARSIRLNLDMTLRIEMIEYQSRNKYLPQFNKGLPSWGVEEQSWLGAKIFSSKAL